ncbi:MAG TPA: phosphatidylglycerophosphatase A, partial [Pyrinomonadaceae bacterium]|nr:phosphatidylglycerophosphatase A [Pyrinomonadaceae bacterium]
IHISAAIEVQELSKEKLRKKTALDYFSLAVTTFGVGYLPLAPGTYGSAVGVLIYLIFASIEGRANFYSSQNNWADAQITAWIHAVNLILFLLFCLLGIWAANRAVKIFQNKDPQQAVVDEVIGQLITFLFVPFAVSWHFVLAGFLLFRLFDIWKPYPIDSLQNLPAGIGVCADDILAGVYAGTCLALIYAVRISF